jgi:hypothetical protein
MLPLWRSGSTVSCAHALCRHERRQESNHGVTSAAPRR